VENAFSVSLLSSLNDVFMILLVASKRDPAGLNIRNQVLSYYPFRESAEAFLDNPVYSAEINGKEVRLITLNEEAVNGQYLPNFFVGSSLIVFISRHSSQSGKPTLSVHTPGNFGPAELGGLPRSISVSPATVMRDALKALLRFKLEFNLDYEVSYECTHHGPSLNVPAMFVELGSSPREWGDLKAAEVVGRAAIEAIAKSDSLESEAVLGIGGMHYNERFTRMALEGEEVFGHMIPKYAVDYLDSKILSQCVEKTVERVSCAVLDWKGIRSGNKAQVLGLLKDAEIPFRKI
jgi:D-aminoacyl-tRNA deacylase